MRMQLHWDGNNISVDERNINASIGAGAIRGMANALDMDGLKRDADWILDLRQPEFPRDRIDEPRLESGRAIYQAYCAQCHSIDGHKIGQVVELSEIGTDPERLRSFSEKLEERLNQTKGNTWAFSHFRKTDGYAGHLFTTARSQRCATCSSRRISAPQFSIVAMTFTTSTTLVSFPLGQRRRHSEKDLTPGNAGTATQGTSTARCSATSRKKTCWST